MIENAVLHKLHAGGISIGSFLGLGSPNAAELMGCAGFEWLVVETEHNGLDGAEVQTMLMAIGNTPAVPMVRVPSSDHVSIQRALDIGAMGVVVPLIRTAEEAQQVVEMTRYPPAGSRSFGPLRASRYTFENNRYFANANDNIIVALIIETAEAVQNLDAIVRVSGVDALYFGPFDLSLALGLDPMRQPHQEIAEIERAALALGAERGVAIGHTASTPQMLRERVAAGYRMIGFGPDYFLLADAARAALDTAKELLAR